MHESERNLLKTVTRSSVNKVKKRAENFFFIFSFIHSRNSWKSDRWHAFDPAMRVQHDRPSAASDWTTEPIFKSSEQKTEEAPPPRLPLLHLPTVIHDASAVLRGLRQTLRPFFLPSFILSLFLFSLSLSHFLCPTFSHCGDPAPPYSPPSSAHHYLRRSPFISLKFQVVNGEQDSSP